MMPWLAPLVYVVVVGAAWLFAPGGHGQRVRAAFARDINFFLVGGLLAVGFGIIGTLNWRVNWVDWMAWILAIGLAGVSLVKLFKPAPLPDDRQDSIDGR